MTGSIQSPSYVLQYRFNLYCSELQVDCIATSELVIHIDLCQLETAGSAVICCKVMLLQLSQLGFTPRSIRWKVCAGGQT